MLIQSGSFPISTDLGNHLHLRVAGPDDLNAIVDFNTRVFDERISSWTRDLMSGGHPTVQAGDFTIVVDTRANEIVSSLCVIAQTWAYGGIPFSIARPELVATNPEYRRRGLVRKQFDFIHARSTANGELMQVITGVDWFYRQFGYEMGMNLWGSRWVEAQHLTKIAERQSIGFRMRPARDDDYNFISETYQYAMRGELFSAVRSPKEWKYEFTGRSKSNTRRREWMILENDIGEKLGYIQYLPCLASPSVPMLRIYQIELKKGIGYLDLFPALLHGLWTKAQELWRDGFLLSDELRGLEFTMERDHPLFRVLPEHLMREIKPSPYYLRLPDPIAFLRHVRPSLEKHLVGTVAEGYSGTLKLNFCRAGLQFQFDRGQITAIEKWLPQELSDGDARFPDATFSHLVYGWRRVDELTDNFPDCFVKDPARVLLDCLFPEYHGKVWVLA